MPKLDDLLRRQADLGREIALLQSQSRLVAIEEVRAIMARHELTAADVAASPRGRTDKPASTRPPVAAKYRDAAGNQWSGRGLKPKWLTQALASGKKLEDFTV